MCSDRHPEVERLLRLVMRIMTACTVTLLVLAYFFMYLEDSTHAVRVQKHPHQAFVGLDRIGWFCSWHHSPGVYLTPSARPPRLRVFPYQQKGAFLQSFWSPEKANVLSAWHGLGVRYVRCTDPFSNCSLVQIDHRVVLCCMALTFWGLVRRRRCRQKHDLTQRPRSVA